MINCRLFLLCNCMHWQSKRGVTQWGKFSSNANCLGTLSQCSFNATRVTIIHACLRLRLYVSEALTWL